MVCNACGAKFGDDYLLDHGYPLETDAQTLNFVNLSPGRKISGRVFALCPNFYNLSKLEVEIGDAVVLLMDVDGDERK